MTAVSIQNVSKSFAGSPAPVLQQVNLNAIPGEILVLLGASGSGKTTLLRTINGLAKPDQGSVDVAGQDITTLDPTILRRSIGYVIQGAALFPHMTVGENISIVPKLLDWTATQIEPRVDELLELVQLDPNQYRGRFPSELSGGEKQRIGVARALAAKPKLLLMDEPFGALDPVTRDQLQTDFKALQRRLELTVILVTHDMTEALLLADRIAILAAGQVAQVGTPKEILDNPASAYIEELLQTPRRQANELKGLFLQ